MLVSLALPDGLWARPLTPRDAATVTALVAAQELADVGGVGTEEADLVADWQHPGYDVSACSVGVFAGDRLVAYAELGGERAEAAVHPDHRGRGLGTALAAWLQELARRHGRTTLRLAMPEGSPGDLLLARLGFEVDWTIWSLRLPAGATVPSRALPEGYAVRAAAEDEHAACWTVTEEAFAEWSGRDLATFAEWASAVTARPGFEPWHLRVVTDPTGEVVAVAVLQMSPGVGYVSRLATRRDQRGLGLAQVLLVDCFARATERGATTCELSTDTRTGALGLYEKVGMRVASTWVVRGTRL